MNKCLKGEVKLSNIVECKIREDNNFNVKILINIICNEMLRKYISKGSDISKYSAEDLDKIVLKLSNLEIKKNKLLYTIHENMRRV